VDRIGLLSLLIFIALQARSENIILEAESAQIVGAHFSDAGTGYSGKGFVTGFAASTDHLVWNFVAEPGDYQLRVTFRSPYGHKDFEGTLNDIRWAGSFPPATVFSNYDAGVIRLNNGTNHLQIGGGMGWYEIDRAVLTPVASATSNDTHVARTDGRVIQIDVKPLLNSRPVSTTQAGRVISWTEGLDGDWSGEATLSAAEAMGNGKLPALPNDGSFPANSRHPAVILNFSDADATGPQVRRSLREDAYKFSVPAGQYSRLILFCMSANGSSQIDAVLTYGDGAVEHRSVVVPDWYNPIAETDVDGFNLALDLPKWNKTNQMTEKDHHYLHGFELRPSPGKTLNSVAINKPAEGTLTFWGATGVQRPE